MSNIPLSQWSDIDVLVNYFLSSKTSYDKYIAAFTKISTALVRHPNPQNFAAKVLRYLKTAEIKEQFENVYNAKVTEIQRSRLDEQEKENNAVLNSQTRIMSQLEVILDNQQKINGVQDQIDTTISDNIDDSSPSTSQLVPTNQTQDTLLPNHVKNIKEVIFNDAVKIHDQYKSSEKLPERKLEAMALGLSCIVDLGRESQTFSFSHEVWLKLVRKYHTRFIMPSLLFSKSYLEKWKHAKHSYTQNETGMSEARKYLCRLQLESVKETDARMLDFFLSLIKLHQANSFMLDKRNESRVSEQDYLYQLRLPTFKNLFNINNNIVRIKTGETVLEGSSAAKSALYDDHTHVIGFKIDLRILMAVA